MTDRTSSRFWRLLFLIAVNSVVFTLCDCQFDQTYAMRSIAAPDLAIDASESKVRMQDYTSQPQQLWKFECGDHPGLFYIVNLNSGKVLDVDRQSDDEDLIFVTTNVKDGTLYQQWYLNENSHISNAAWLKDLDIFRAIYVFGERLQLFQTDSWPTQNFTILEVS